MRLTAIDPAYKVSSGLTTDPSGSSFPLSRLPNGTQKIAWNKAAAKPLA
jgi:hypothetical protein